MNYGNNDPYNPKKYMNVIDKMDEQEMSNLPSPGEEPVVSDMPTPQIQGGGAAGGSAGTKEKQLGQAAMMSGNPYLMAGGLALQAYGSAKDRELAREVQAVNNEIARRNRVMEMMSQLGQGFGSLG